MPPRPPRARLFHRAATGPGSYFFSGASPAGPGTGVQQQAGAVAPGGTTAASQVAGSGEAHRHILPTVLCRAASLAPAPAVFWKDTSRHSKAATPTCDLPGCPSFCRPGQRHLRGRSRRGPDQHHPGRADHLVPDGWRAAWSGQRCECFPCIHYIFMLGFPGVVRRQISARYACTPGHRLSPSLRPAMFAAASQRIEHGLCLGHIGSHRLCSGWQSCHRNSHWR